VETPYRLCRHLSPLLIFIISINILGCIMGSTEYDLNFNDKEIERIQSGITTKDEILNWFGPPNAMASKTKRLQFAVPAAGGETNTINYEILFELFSTKHQLTNEHSVYFYYTSDSSQHNFAFLLREMPGVDKLWILINQESGLVEDYVFRPRM